MLCLLYQKEFDEAASPPVIFSSKCKAGFLTFRGDNKRQDFGERYIIEGGHYIKKLTPDLHDLHKILTSYLC